MVNDVRFGDVRCERSLDPRLQVSRFHRPLLHGRETTPNDHLRSSEQGIHQWFGSRRIGSDQCGNLLVVENGDLKSGLSLRAIGKQYRAALIFF